MVDIQIDAVTFPLKEYHDFSWLRRYGRVFCVFSENDSGNISFGLDDGGEKYFIKVAGIKTAGSARSPEEAVKTLKAAMPVYEDLRHPNLIRLEEHFPLDETYVAVFRWAEGECLFDHWNFQKYRQNPQLKSPAAKFRELSLEKRLKALDVIFSFMLNAAEKDYAAVDFYDGSILYDFTTDTTTICDIDLFRIKPVVNDMGEDFWGTKRMKAPEEYVYGAMIDETTGVHTLGALIFHFFGRYTQAEISQMYENNAFFPCPRERWELSGRLYEIAGQAANADRNKRYRTVLEFYEEWKNFIRGGE